MFNKSKLVNILGINFLSITNKQFVDQLKTDSNLHLNRFVVTANPEIVLAARKDKEYANIINSADYVVADGIGIIKGAKILKKPLPERVTGYDTMLSLLSWANQEHKKISKMEKINIKTFKEPDSVVLKEETIKMTTDVPKLAYTIKLSCNNFSIEKRKLNIYLYILFSILFDDSSKFNEIAKNNNIITNSVYVNILNCDTHILVSLLNETFKYKELINMIKEELKDIKISEKDLERKKRVLISNEIFSYENVEIVNEMIIDNIIFDNSVEENIVDIINSLNIEEMTEIIDNIDFNNVSTIILKSDKE